MYDNLPKLTEHPNRPPKPREYPRRTYGPARESVLDGSDEKTRRAGDRCGFDGATDGIFRMVWPFIAVMGGHDGQGWRSSGECGNKEE